MSIKKKELPDFLNKKEIDTITYSWAMTEVGGNDFASIEDFSLFSDSLEIVDPLEFPGVIKFIEPVYELKYSYKVLNEYLKPEFLNRLTR